MNHNKAFTLVEILIVVTILGILAAIVIPQFTAASDDARLSALSSDLQTVRSQIELYKVQHGDTLPTAALVNELTSKTDFSGAVGTGVTHIYGPYLQKFPTNPYVTGGDSVETGTAAPGVGPESGWYYNTTSGAFAPDDADHSTM